MALHGERTGEETSAEKIADTIVEPEDIAEDEEAHVLEMLEWVKRVEAQTWPDNSKIEDICRQNRKYVKGQQHSDGNSGLVRANLIQANLRKSINRTYARNPQISIIPTEAVTSNEYQKFRALGKTSEIVVNHFLDKARIKKKAKAALRAAKTCRIGWIKVGLQKDLETDVYALSRINDLQDNLQDLERLKLEATDPAFNHDEQSKVDSLILQRKQLLESMEKGVEVLKASGITLDLIKTEHMLIDVAQVEDLDDYVSAHRIGQKYFMTRTKALNRYGDKAKGLDTFSPLTKDGTPVDHKGNADAERAAKISHIFEIWDRSNLKVYTIGKGYKGYLRDPITPQEEVGEQWYPYFPLAINRIDGQFWPQSDVELLMELQDEISASLTKFKDHREKSIPYTLFEKGAIDVDEALNVTQPKPFELVGIKGIPDKKLNDILFNVSHNAIDPQVYATEHLERKMEQVTGAAEASQPKSNRSKTFGEAKILTNETQTDSSSDQDEIEDWFRDLATYVWQILLKILTPDQVKEIAGNEAQWPDTNLSLPRIYNQLRLKVIPGSSGKPDKIREREGLTQIMPVAGEMITSISELMEKGQFDMAETQKIVLQEFLRRADERFDVQEFFPNAADEKKQRQEQREAQKAKQQKEDQAFQVELELKKAEITKFVSEATKNVALADAAGQTDNQPEDNSFELQKHNEEMAQKDRSDKTKADNDLVIAREKIVSAERIKKAELDSAERIAEIEKKAKLDEARIEEKIKEKEFVTKKNIEEAKNETQKETAKIGAKAQAKAAAAKSSETKKEPAKDNGNEKTDKILGAALQGLTAVIKKQNESDGSKDIVFTDGKPTGIRPVKDKRTVN